MTVFPLKSSCFHPFVPLGVLLRIYIGFIHSVSSKMPPLTQLRKRLSLEEKVQFIDDSIKSGFNKANAMKKYGIFSLYSGNSLYSGKFAADGEFHYIESRLYNEV